MLLVWRGGSVLPSRVSIWMDDRLSANKPSQNVTSCLGQLSFSSLHGRKIE